MAQKGTQVVTGSSTKLPGSSAPTERPAYPGRLPVSAAALYSTARAGQCKRVREEPGQGSAVRGGSPRDCCPNAQEQLSRGPCPAGDYCQKSVRGIFKTYSSRPLDAFPVTIDPSDPSTHPRRLPVPRRGSFAPLIVYSSARCRRIW
jgi:hypothetical protein